SGGIRQVQSYTDYSSYGGAPILGFERLCIKAHGRSNHVAVKNAIKVAAKAVRENVVGNMQGGIAEFERLRAAAADDEARKEREEKRARAARSEEDLPNV
ncbi:MAG: hypothetical protein K8I02_09195, partial [Candidatus Methylomirabilis sp.]|nr:hypothetical protein [Deltaproteobacteria bacterium]